MKRSHRFVLSTVAALSLTAAIPALAAPGDMASLEAGMMGQMMHTHNMQGGHAGMGTGPHGAMASDRTGPAGAHQHGGMAGATATGAAAMMSMRSHHGPQADRKQHPNGMGGMPARAGLLGEQR